MLSKISLLERHVPQAAAPVIARWIDHFECEFKVSRNRNTKFGDYRPPQRGHTHRISVNFGLNPYAFLVTTVHEFAHLYTWNCHKNKAKPHGEEWKCNFRRMMQPFFKLGVFPPDLEHALTAYLVNPAASSCNDEGLFSTLKKYDPDTGYISLDSLQADSLFVFNRTRIFKKEHKLRKRIKCTEIESGRAYLFNPLTEVYPLKKG